MSPQMPNLMINGSTKSQIFAEKQIFFEIFHFFQIKYTDIFQEGVYGEKKFFSNIILLGIGWDSYSPVGFSM